MGPLVSQGRCPFSGNGKIRFTTTASGPEISVALVMSL
jgi:hypothetical protein